jgi:hypothetical protein
VFFNVFNIKNEGAIIIYVEKWFVPSQILCFKIESEFSGDRETIQAPLRLFLISIF